MVCDDNVGNESIKVEVKLQGKVNNCYNYYCLLTSSVVPGSPNVTVIPTYLHKSKKLSGLKTQFSKVL